MILNYENKQWLIIKENLLYIYLCNENFEFYDYDEYESDQYWLSSSHLASIFDRNSPCDTWHRVAIIECDIVDRRHYSVQDFDFCFCFSARPFSLCLKF